MTVYALVELETTNAHAMRPYREGVYATVSAHGGKYLVKAETPR